MRLGSKMSAESCRRISESKKGLKQTAEHIAKRMASMPPNHWVGRKHTKKTVEKMRRAKLGRKHTEETKKKMASHEGAERYNFKGENANYRSIHAWVTRKLGKPRFCENCGNRNLRHRQYHWANISRTYKRIISDWRRLCVKCHMAYDRAKS